MYYLCGMKTEYKISQDWLTILLVTIITGKKPNSSTILSNANVKLFHLLTFLIPFIFSFLFISLLIILI